MKKVIHKSSERGHANHGWLNSYHSFSFASFYDAQKMNFGLLRVLNDDTVSQGMGFGEHGHENMEIVSIPLSGELAHKDSTGRNEIIRTNDVQIMSAGSGILHSEFNHSREREVKFLQIWVFPKKRDIEPLYEQKTFLPVARENKLLTVVSPNGENGSISINQDAWFSLGYFNNETSLDYSLNKKGNGAYIFVLNGEAEVEGSILENRDAIGVWEIDNVNIKVKPSTELLIIDVPMELN